MARGPITPRAALGSDPFLSRAFYAYLAQRAQSAGHAPQCAASARATRSLRRASTTPRCALMQRIGFEIDSARRADALPAGHDRGEAQRRGARAQALERTADAARTSTPIEWQLTLARTALQAGDAAASADDDEASARPGARRSRRSSRSACSSSAQEMLDMRKTDAAQAVYELLAPRRDRRRMRAKRCSGSAARTSSSGEPRAAPRRTTCARRCSSRRPRRTRSRSRRGCSRRSTSCARDCEDDARAQFEWLLKNAKDPALIEAAKRGLRSSMSCRRSATNRSGIS